MTKEDLMKFCKLDHKMINRPWTRDGHTHATNGQVLVRVPAMDDIPDNPDAPDTLILERKTPFPEKYIPLSWLVLPEPVMKICEYCKGSGKEHRLNEACEECDGVGKFEEPRKIMMSKTFFLVELIRTIRELPNCEIGVNDLSGDIRSLPASRFRFDGGDGFIMPCFR